MKIFVPYNSGTGIQNFSSRKIDFKLIKPRFKLKLREFWSISCAGEVTSRHVYGNIFLPNPVLHSTRPRNLFSSLGYACRPQKKKKRGKKNRETRKATKNAWQRRARPSRARSGFVYLRLENTADRYNERISGTLQQRGGGPVIIQITRRRGYAT